MCVGRGAGSLAAERIWRKSGPVLYRLWLRHHLRCGLWSPDFLWDSDSRSRMGLWLREFGIGICSLPPEGDIEPVRLGTLAQLHSFYLMWWMLAQVTCRRLADEYRWKWLNDNLRVFIIAGSKSQMTEALDRDWNSASGHIELPHRLPGTMRKNLHAKQNVEPLCSFCTAHLHDRQRGDRCCDHR